MQKNNETNSTARTPGTRSQSPFPANSSAWTKKYQGLEIPDLHSEQLISHIMALLQFGAEPNNVIGMLIQAYREVI